MILTGFENKHFWEQSSGQPKIVYKIKNKKTGEYSIGGKRAKFSRQGKIWTTSNYILAHLEQIDLETRRNYRDNCEIVAFTLTEHSTFNNWI